MISLDRKKVSILDYGVGNIMSLKNSLERMGYHVSVEKSKTGLKNKKVIFLPGVGSFPFAMSNLKKSGMDMFLKECFGSDDVIVIGICLGMQILFDSSEEGHQNGLGIIKGQVKKFRNKECHVGWNIVNPTKTSLIKQKAGFYFNHSFYVDCSSKFIIANSSYQKDFAAIVNSRNFYGLQFHPEKSQNAGIHILNQIIGE